MLELTHALLFTLSVVFLIWSGSVLVRHLTKVAGYLKLTEFVIGFILMAFATSIPELLVGMQSALSGVPLLSLGDVIGSNILDVTLVLGLVLLMARKVRITSITTRKNALYPLIISLLPFVLAFDGLISRFDAVVLLLILGWYLRTLYLEQKEFSKITNHIKREQFITSASLSALAIFVLLVSSYYTVHYATLMAQGLGLPLFFIGILLLAFGTSLPELVFETKSILKGHSDMALGDLYGSIVFNSTGVLGVTALIAPIAIVNLTQFYYTGIFLLFAMFLFYVFIQHGKLTWREGIVLIMIYAIFLLVEVELGIGSGQFILSY